MNLKRKFLLTIRQRLSNFTSDINSRPNKFFFYNIFEEIMKKLLKVAGIVLSVIALAIVAFLIYFNSAFPKVSPPSSVKVEITPQRIARGEYLANNVAICTGCHSERDWTKYAGPLKPGTFGEGGEEFSKEMLADIPGVIYAKNITPAAVGNWTDGELIRAITQGVEKDGSALFPLMPYLAFNNLTKEDLYSIVAYVRSLRPIKNAVPARHLDFPMNFIVKTIPPESYTPAPEPDTSNPIVYGKYLVNLAGCGDCHTQSIKGEPIKGMEFAGGMAFHLPWGIVSSANITPDPETGIGNWTKEQFIDFFKAFAPDSAKNIPVKPGEFNTVMPITQFAEMSRRDLGDIYSYLRTLKPVHNVVVKYTPNK
jgi:hypothetical protein